MKKQLEEEAEHDYPESDLEDEYEDETYEDEEDGMTEEQRYSRRITMSIALNLTFCNFQY